ncbi:DNA gyrase subunit A [Actinobacillus pleuropneumoniae]|nr:DNA gyrase subunit A [Actinobacillus pleuropneumoniae]
MDEYKALLTEIGELLRILSSAERLMEVIREELEKVKAEFGDERRTEITAASGDINMEDLIAQEDVVVTLSHAGYVKYQPLSDYEAQRRGGKGKSATKMKEDDFIEKLLVANTHDTILCFSSRGRLYQLKVYQLPQASRGARGTPIVNILPLVKEENERITAILPIPNGEFSADKFIFMATASGVVKKVSLDAFSNVRSSGLIALKLREGDELIGVDITDGESEIMLFSAQGRVVRFAEKAVRAMGRTATGVRGIKLATTDISSEEIEEAEIVEIENEEADESSVSLDTDRVVSLVIPRTEGDILTVTQNGFGKRTVIGEYPVKSRATKGVVSIKVNERNGKVVAAVQVEEADQIMLITDAGTLVRTRVAEVSLVGRNTQGVRIIRTADDESVVSVERVCEPDDEDENSEALDNVESTETSTEA